MRKYTLALLTALVPAACTTGPHNGTTTNAASVVGKTFFFQGYHNTPNALIKLQVLEKPEENPAIEANWTQFATATTGTEPTYVNSDDPLYYWSVTAAPVPIGADRIVAARWPQGGLVRTRAIHINSNGQQRILTTFDEVTFSDCLTEQMSAGADWGTIGTKCAGLGEGTTTLVSTTNVPTPPGSDASFQANGFLGKKGKIAPAETEQYYAQINAPANLGAFKAKYNFPAGEVTATYYNDGDLGLGREMHCKPFVTPALLVGVACYVTNYSGKTIDGKGVAAFGINVNTVLADAVAKQHPFATVAMVYDPPGGGTNSVKFMVYGEDGEQLTEAQLDDTQNNKSIPNNCLACHGINSSYNTATNSVSGNAEFLPFDPFSFKYSNQAGFTQADQADEIRRLNAIIKIANPSPAILGYINGLYAPKSVNDASAVANPDFVPDAWANANGSLAGTAIYSGMVRVGCRTCHMSASIASLDFAEPQDFDDNIVLIRDHVCGTHIMPHAEHVMKKFWASGARAYLVTAYGPAPNAYPDLLQACKP